MKTMRFFTLLVIALSTPHAAKGAAKYNFDSCYFPAYSTHYIQTFPDNEDCILAYYCLQEYYTHKKDTPNLKKVCIEVLNKHFNAAQIKFTNQRWNSFNKPADLLSCIYLAEDNYDEALRYLYMCDTFYHYRSDCGNDLYYHKIKYALRYAIIFEKQGKKEMAISALLKECFNHESRRHLEKLKQLLSGYNKEQLKKELNYAINHFTTDTLKYKDGSTYCKDYIHIMNTKIDTYDYYISSSTKAEKIQFLKQSEFYKMVMAL